MESDSHLINLKTEEVNIDYNEASDYISNSFTDRLTSEISVAEVFQQELNNIYCEEVALIWLQSASKAIILQSFILHLNFKTSHICVLIANTYMKREV